MEALFAFSYFIEDFTLSDSKIGAHALLKNILGQIIHSFFRGS